MAQPRPRPYLYRRVVVAPSGAADSSDDDAMINDASLPQGPARSAVPRRRHPAHSLIVSPLMTVLLGLVLAVLMIAFAAWLCAVGLLSTATGMVRLARYSIGGLGYRPAGYPSR